MDWFRHYHGLCTDPKLHRIAKVAKVSRGLVIAAWCAILEVASQNDPRGVADDIDDTALAFMIDVKPGVAERILGAIRAANLIDSEGNVAAWSKRQRASDDGAVRVAKHRERQAVNEVRGKKRSSHDRAEKDNPLMENETDYGGNVTKPSRTEQNRTDSVSSEEDTAPSGALLPFPSRPEPAAKRSPEHVPKPETDMRKLAYDVGKAMLGARCGGLITKAISQIGVGQVVEILDHLRREDPIEPVPYFQKSVETRASPRRFIDGAI